MLAVRAPTKKRSPATTKAGGRKLSTKSVVATNVESGTPLHDDVPEQLVVKPQVKERTATSPKPKEATTQVQRIITAITTRHRPVTSSPQARHPASLSREGQDTTFLDLPAEMRNEIYGYAIPCQQLIAVNHTQPYLLEPNLLAVNRQVRSETLPFFYGENDFQIQGSSPAVKFLRSLSTQKTRSLRSLQIKCEIPRPVEEGRERIRKLNQDFRANGLHKQAVRFQVNAGGLLVWANLDELRGLAKRAAG